MERTTQPRQVQLSPFKTVLEQQQPAPAFDKWRAVYNRYKPQKSAVPFNLELILLAAVCYGVLVFSMGDIWLPGHAPFCTILIWICAVAAAEIANWLRVPRVVFMLGSGLLLANVPGGVVAAFPAKWGVQLRAAALATIFLRCGLELEFKTMRLYKWPALRLAFIPGLIEAFFDGGIASVLFKMPIMLAISMGFILKAVGPGLVVPAMFQLQKAGWGANKGIPSTVVISASFDDIVAITGFSIFFNIAAGSGSNAAWQIASGPLQVIFGILGGALAGVVLGATKIFNNKYKRLIGIYGSALLIMFFLEYFDMLSGGALGSLATGLVTCYMWESGYPAKLSLGPQEGYTTDIERVMAKVWNWVMEPMLFATIGTSIVFANLSSSTIPLAVLIVCTGLTLRTIASFFTMMGFGYTWKERLFYAIAWTPKATVQASLSAVALTFAQNLPDSDPNKPEWLRWGADILTTGVFAIIICASFGTLLVFVMAPILLEKQEEPLMKRGMSGDRQGGGERGTITRQTTAQLASKYPSLSLEELRQVSNHALIDDYFDAIENLLHVIRSDIALNPKAEDMVVKIEDLQQRIDREVGPRELTVRQLLHVTALKSGQTGIARANTERQAAFLAQLAALSSNGGESFQRITPAILNSMPSLHETVQAPAGKGDASLQSKAKGPANGDVEQGTQDGGNPRPSGSTSSRDSAENGVSQPVLNKTQ